MTEPHIDPTRVTSAKIFDFGEETAFCLAADTNRRRLYVGGSDRLLHVFDLAAQAEENTDAKSDSGKKGKKEPPRLPAIARWQHHRNYVSAAAFRAGDDPLLVTGSYDRTLAWWDLEAGRTTRTVEAHAQWVRDVAFFPDGMRLASVGDDMMLKIWDVADGKLIHKCAGHATRTPEGMATALYCVAISPDGQHVATADRHGEVRIWNAQTGRVETEFACPKLYTFDAIKRSRALGGIRSVAFSPSGNELAVAGIGPVTNVDGFVGPARLELWNWREDQRLFAAQHDKHMAILNHVAFHPSGKWIIGAGGGDGGGLIASVVTNIHEQQQEKPDDKNAETDLTMPLERARASEHIHDFTIDPSGELLYAAGWGKAEVWSLLAPDEPKE